MSEFENLPINPVRSKTLYRYHTNASREIALVDFLNDGFVQPNALAGVSKDGVTVHDKEDMYRMGKKQELKVGSVAPKTRV